MGPRNTYRLEMKILGSGAIYIPNSNNGKGILILNSYKALASKHCQYDPRWYQCHDKYAYDAFGTGIHSSVNDDVVNFDVELKTKETT